MNQEQIENLVSRKKFSHECDKPEVVETHISWVFICDEYVYKIKKPVQFAFVDFATLELRKFYCEREIELNNRLTEGIYLEVVPVTLLSGEFTVDAEGRTKDYAVKMKKMDPARRMDLILKEQKAEVEHVQAIADQLAAFHRETSVHHFAVQLGLKQDFDDMLKNAEKLSDELDQELLTALRKQVNQAHAFIAGHAALFERRDQAGFIRDCHGDLHSGNIFLLDEPVIFDCIEFNDDLRRIDILSELAFLCMDLDAYGYGRLSTVFFDYYNQLLPVSGSEDEDRLFVFYKAFRASVRCKISAINALHAKSAEHKQEALGELARYAAMMREYLEACTK